MLSPKDRARRIVLDFSGQTFSDTTEADEWLQQSIEDAIQATVNAMIEEYRRRTGDDLRYFLVLER